jgi:hypothetical protein
MFEVREGQPGRLVAEMRQCRCNYSRVLEVSQRQEFDIKMLRQESQYQGSRI